MKKAKTLAESPENQGQDGKPIWNAKEILVMMDNMGNSNIPLDLADPEEPEPGAPEKESESQNSGPSQAAAPAPKKKTISVNKDAAGQTTGYVVIEQ